jgi:transposase
MTPRRLNELEELELVARYQAGSTERQLAERFGVGRASVQRTLDRHGVTRRPPANNLRPRDDVPTSRIVELRLGEGLSWFQIARRVGMKPSGVRRRFMEAMKGDA